MHEQDAAPERAAVWVDSTTELVASIEPGMSLAVGGFHFTRAPVAAIGALVDRGVTGLTYHSWGGGVPLELLLAGDAVSEVDLCFSALDVFGSAPRFRRAAESGLVRVRDHTALELLTALRAAGENLPWEIMPAPSGSVFATQLRSVDDGSGGTPLGRVAPAAPDVMLLHAQRADDDGNVELQGALGTDLSTVFAARRVLVTVEERVGRGELGAPRARIVPRSHIHAVCLAPGGAYPTSCLPYYRADYAALADLADPERRERPRTDAAPDRSHRATASPPALVDAVRARARPMHGAASVAELMTVVIARTVDDASVCTFGSAAVLPAAAYLLAKSTHAPGAQLMSFNGGFVDIAARPVTLGLAEQMDFASAAVHTGGDETYRWYYQPGRITHEVVGAAQIDRAGRTNNLWIARADGSRIRLPGQGGMADVANLHRDFFLYVPRHGRRNLVAALDQVSAARAWADDATRRARGLMPGRVTVLTDLGVFGLDPDRGALVLQSVHPGVEVERVSEATGFDLIVDPDLATTPSPTPDELRMLRETVDPLGLRDLDFLPARERTASLGRILAAEADAVAAAFDLDDPDEGVTA